MKKRVNPTLFDVQPYIPGQPIEEVKRNLGLRSVIKLASNENPYGPTPNVLKAIEQAALNLNRYPESGCHYLRKELAKQLSVASDQLIFGNGSDEIIVLAVRAFVQPSDEVVMATPSFLIYQIASQIAGAKIKAIPLNNFHYDLDAMKKAITQKTKMVFLGNPDNPAGSYLSQNDVDNFLKGLPKDVLVFIDEAYFEYVDASDYVDSIALIKKHPNVLVSRTFSKMYGLAGLRVGYGVGHKDVLSWLDRIREPFNVNSIAQAAALACLKDKKYLKTISKVVKEQRHYLYDNFHAMNLSYVESYTNFILVDVHSSAKVVAKKLLHKGVIVRDMSIWGLNQYIRVTIGTEKENKRFIKALKDIL